LGIATWTIDYAANADEDLANMTAKKNISRQLVALLYLSATVVTTTGVALAQATKDADRPTLTSRVPSNSEVISAVVTAMNKGDREKLAAMKQELSSDLTECASKAAACRQATQVEQSQRVSGAAVAAAITQSKAPGPEAFAWHGPSGALYPTRDACGASEEQSCEALPHVKDQRSRIAAFRYGAEQYVFTVVRTNNYEGNIISYVDVRTKGTDDIERDKMTIQLINNAWVVVAAEAVSRQ
jgi:hypothetical protein